VVRTKLPERTIRRIEQSTGRLATLSVARMDAELSWFRALPADQRSWVMLVAQTGIASLVQWLRNPDEVLRLTGEVFRTAPRELARSVTLQQTVELVQQTIAVAEEQLPQLADDADRALLREEMLLFSREIAFAAARVYASVAEVRGAWDARLEALVIEGFVRGSSIVDEPASQLAALGWRSAGPITAVVGAAPDRSSQAVLADVHRAARRAGFDAMVAVHGDRLVVVLGGVGDPIEAASSLLANFADGPVVAGPIAADVGAASAVTQAALSALRAVPAWPGAPRPVSSDALLPERALAGDTAARDGLNNRIYQPLVDSGDVLLATLTSFFACGSSLEATARELFVHANTVRYRLRRVAQVSGANPTDARDAFTLQVALALGRLDLTS
jgi:PucR C-terminal helix-turn-helix domain/GGDEF-like domain